MNIFQIHKLFYILEHFKIKKAGDICFPELAAQHSQAKKHKGEQVEVSERTRSNGKKTEQTRPASEWKEPSRNARWADP